MYVNAINPQLLYKTLNYSYVTSVPMILFRNGANVFLQHASRTHLDTEVTPVNIITEEEILGRGGWTAHLE